MAQKKRQFFTCYVVPNFILCYTLALFLNNELNMLLP